VVDCGFSVEQDEEIVYDTMARGATVPRSRLEAADVVLCVCSADRSACSGRCGR